MIKWKEELNSMLIDNLDFNNEPERPMKAKIGYELENFIQSLLDKRDKEWIERIINDAEKRKATLPIKIDGKNDSVPYADFIIHNGLEDIKSNLNK